MKRLKIEHSLNSWFNQMLDKYEDLSFKFEFSDRRRVFLVSYCVTEHLAERIDFCTDIMRFEDKLNLEYGLDAPLFCENESIFQLSASAEIKYKRKSAVLGISFDWNSPILYLDINNFYPLAA